MVLCEVCYDITVILDPSLAGEQEARTGLYR